MGPVTSGCDVGDTSCTTTFQPALSLIGILGLGPSVMPKLVQPTWMFVLPAAVCSAHEQASTAQETASNDSSRTHAAIMSVTLINALQLKGACGCIVLSPFACPTGLPDAAANPNQQLASIICTAAYGYGAYATHLPLQPRHPQLNQI